MELQGPDPFVPEFSKDFSINGNVFTIELQRNDPFEIQHNIDSYLVWFFRIVVNGQILKAGPFRWNSTAGIMTDQKVAKLLADFFGYSDFNRMKAEAIATEGSLGIRIRSIIWDSFYSGWSSRRPSFDAVQLLWLRIDGDDWTAMVFVDNDFGLEKKIYKLAFDESAQEVSIEVYEWLVTRTIAY